MRPYELERQLRKQLDALGPAPRAELLHVLMLPDFDRVDRIGSYWGTRRPAPSPSSYQTPSVDVKLPAYLRRRQHEIPLGPEEALA